MVKIHWIVHYDVYIFMYVYYSSIKSFLWENKTKQNKRDGHLIPLLNSQSLIPWCIQGTGQALDGFFLPPGELVQKTFRASYKWVSAFFFCSFSAPDIPRLCWLPDSSCTLLLPCCTPVRWTYTMHHVEAVCIYVLPSSYKTKSSNILTHSLLNYYESLKKSAEKNTGQTYYIQSNMYGYTYIWHRFHFLSNTFHYCLKY